MKKTSFSHALFLLKLTFTFACSISGSFFSPFLSSYISSVALAQSPESILQKADEVRNPSASFKMEVEVKNPGGDDTSVFEVALKGKEKTMIKTLEPSRDKGRNMLMLNEDMWAYIPNLKRSVRISLNQKLTGQAANGDISRMRWAGDYDAKIESQDATKWVLFLTATKKGLTYDKIRATVDKKSFHPLKAISHSRWKSP